VSLPRIELQERERLVYILGLGKGRALRLGQARGRAPRGEDRLGGRVLRLEQARSLYCNSTPHVHVSSLGSCHV